VKPTPANKPNLLFIQHDQPIHTLTSYHADQPLAQPIRVRAHGEATTLVVHQAQTTPTPLLPEDPVFLIKYAKACRS